MGSQKPVQNIYFGRTDIQSVRFLTGWLNKDFDFGIKRLEDLCTGVAYCQIMHKMFPKALPLKCVNFMADNRRDYEINLVLLRKCFHRLNISKSVPEELKFARGHLEFASWMFKFHQFNNQCSTYDAKKERELAQPPAIPKRFMSKLGRCNTVLGTAPKLNVPKKPIVFRSHSVLAEVKPTVQVEQHPKKQLQNPELYYEECKCVPLPGSESDSEHTPEAEEPADPVTTENSIDKPDILQMLKTLISQHEEYAVQSLNMINDVNMDELSEKLKSDEEAHLAAVTDKFELMKNVALKHSDSLIRAMFNIQSKVFECSSSDVTSNTV